MRLVAVAGRELAVRAEPAELRTIGELAGTLSNLGFVHMTARHDYESADRWFREAREISGDRDDPSRWPLSCATRRMPAVRLIGWLIDVSCRRKDLSTAGAMLAGRRPAFVEDFRRADEHRHAERRSSSRSAVSPIEHCGSSLLPNLTPLLDRGAALRFLDEATSMPQEWQLFAAPARRAPKVLDGVSRFALPGAGARRESFLT